MAHWHKFWVLGLEGNSVIHPSPSKHADLIVCCVVILPVLTHLHVERNLFPSLLGIDDYWKFPHCVDWNHSSQYLQFTGSEPLRKRRLEKHRSSTKKKKKPFRYLEAIWFFQCSLSAKEGNMISKILFILVVFFSHWFLSSHKPSM